MVKRYDIDYIANELGPLPHGRMVMHEEYEKLLAVAKELAHLVEYDLGDQVEEAALAKLEELLRG